MTKSRARPSAGASRRNSRAESAWNVDSQMCRQSSPTSRSTRSRISSEALFVKVTARISYGAAFFSVMRCAIRCAMTRVLPDPAPARMSSGPFSWSTASR